MAADHEAGGACLGEDAQGGGGGGDVAIGDDGAGDGANRASDLGVADLAAIHLLHGAAVDDEQINAVARDGSQDAIKVTSVLEADAHFYGEESRAGGAHGCDDGINMIGVAQQTATDIFLVNFWRGTAEVEVDTGYGVMQELGDGARKMGDLLANELGEDRASGAILVDGAEYVFFRP
ncbi:MAG: hypothetical protein RIQ79_327 [Verrucomicrobiota bacterium]